MAPIPFIGVIYHETLKKTEKKCGEMIPSAHTTGEKNPTRLSCCLLLDLRPIGKVGMA